mmetsp:Transcript_28130/g.90542  ORF Transcript_28130/g.90542 Transcript_28130/m.90542 type:complete len:314 (+) Transcript_28130:2183-3124(+)
MCTHRDGRTFRCVPAALAPNTRDRVGLFRGPAPACAGSAIFRAWLCNRGIAPIEDARFIGRVPRVAHIAGSGGRRRRCRRERRDGTELAGGRATGDLIVIGRENLGKASVDAGIRAHPDDETQDQDQSAHDDDDRAPRNPASEREQRLGGPRMVRNEDRPERSGNPMLGSQLLHNEIVAGRYVDDAQTDTLTPNLTDCEEWGEEEKHEDESDHDAEAHEEAELTQRLQHTREVCEEADRCGQRGRKATLAGVQDRERQPCLSVHLHLLRLGTLVPKINEDEDNITADADNQEDRHEGSYGRLFCWRQDESHRH